MTTASDPGGGAPAQRRPWSLRVQVGAALAVLIFVVAIALAGLVGQVMVAQLRESVGESLASDAARMAERLNKEMAARSRELMLIGALDPMRTLRDAREVQSLLDGLRRSVPAYLWLGVTDTAGRMVAATDPSLVGTDFSSRAETRDGLRGDTVRLAGRFDRPLDPGPDPRPDPRPAEAAPRLAEPRPMTLVHPVRAPNGEVAGVIVAQLGWGWVRDMERALLTRDPDKLAERSAVLVAANDSVLLGQQAMVGSRLPLASVARARAGFPGYAMERFPDGQDYLTGAALAEGEGPAPGLGSQEMRWTVLVRESASSAYAAARDLRGVILLAGMGLAAVFALIGCLVTYRITAPLHRIALAADRLRLGQDAEIPRLPGVAEIESLSDSLRAMVAALTSKQRQLDIMEAVAQHDPLTGLLNRTGLQNWLRRAQGRARMKRTGLLVLVGDLDGFKQVNDTLGHQAGDLLLRALAQRLTRNVRTEDAVARLGGDEFVVALDAPLGCSDGEALDRAKRVWGAVIGAYDLGGETVQVGLSMGGAFWPDDAAELDQALQQADMALYAAKRAGKARVALFRDIGPDMGGPRGTPGRTDSGPAPAGAHAARG